MSWTVGLIENPGHSGSCLPAPFPLCVCVCVAHALGEKPALAVLAIRKA